jgi:aminoglycoside 3-N-acetyltransferase
MNLQLFENVNAADIIEALHEIGIAPSDILFVHSDLTAFGKLALLDRDNLCRTLIDTLQKSIGRQGTLIMPTFTYSFCQGLPYDLYNSPSTVGALTEYFRRQTEVIRTRHPLFSVAICGPQKEVLQQVDLDSFGPHSIFALMRKGKGKFLFFGAAFQACTFIHHIEQMHGVPYRYMKEFLGTIKEGEQEYSAIATYFVRYLEKNVIVDLKRFEKYLLENEIMVEAKLGKGRLLAIEAEQLFQAGWKLLDQDIYYFLKEPPLV